MPASDVTVTATFWENGPFTDTRDHKVYETTVIGGKTWMAENLNYQTSSGSWCNDCDKYGRLYDWNTARTVCPTGWHLPSRDEWNALVSATGESNVGKALKSTSGWKNNGNGTDDYGFSALPGGSHCYANNFCNVGSHGYWWTVTEAGSDMAYYRIMSSDNNQVGEFSLNKGDGNSVRCVAD
jgi:uncharacterized protein (TIGR02145 family)